MVVNGGDAQRTHGGEEHGAVEGADLQQEPGNEAKIVQGFQHPHGEFQKHTGHQGKSGSGVVQGGVQRRILYNLHLLVDFPVHILGGVHGGQMYLDDGLRGVGGHILFHSHAELQICAMGEDFLTGDEPVHLGVLGNAVAVGCQQHMNEAEAHHALSSLLTDIPLHIGDFKGGFKLVVRLVPIHHDVRDNLIQRRLGANPPSVGPVSPGGMPLADGMGFGSKDNQHQSQGHQGVRQHGFVISQEIIGKCAGEQSRIFHGQQSTAVEIKYGSKGNEQYGNQQPHEIGLFCGNLGIHGSHENQGNGIKNSNHGIHVLKVHRFKYKEEVNGNEPYGNGSLVEVLFPGFQDHQGKQHAGKYRQNDLAPRIGSFRTDDQNAGHSRTYHAKRRQPGQHILVADEQCDFSIHGPHYSKKILPVNKKRLPRGGQTVYFRKGCASKRQ